MNGMVDAKKFRTAMGHFATGVTVIVSGQSDDIHAMTANAVTSVSLDPPLILVCIDSRAKMLKMIHDTGTFSVNILPRHQEALSRHFANQFIEEVPDVEFKSSSASPTLQGALVSIVCTVANTVEAGDHTIFLGHVEHVEMSEGDPLIFYQGKYRELAEVTAI